MSTIPNSKTIEKAISSSTAFDYFGADVCGSMDVINQTGVDIYVRQDVKNEPGVPQLCKDGTYCTVEGIENANQVWISRASGSGSITVQARIYA
jgi:hypothetical protein